MRRPSLLAVAAAAAIAVAACSPSTSPGPTSSVQPSGGPTPEASGSPAPSTTATNVRLQLSGPIDAEFAGYIAAQALGYYDEENLEVQLLPATSGTDVVQQASAANGPEFAIANVPDVLAAREKGSDLVDIAQVFQRSGTVFLTWRKSNVADACGLIGKRVGLWPSPADVELTSSLATCPLKTVCTNCPGYTRVEVPRDVAAFLGNRVDGTEAEIYDQYAQVLEATNPTTNQQYTTDDLVALSPEDQQTNVLQDAVVARSGWLTATGNSDTASGFLRAAAKGWLYCRDHQEDCVQFVLKAGSNLGTTHQRWMLNEVNALVWPSGSGFGEPDAVQWQRTIDVSIAAGLIKSRPDPNAFDDTYLQAATGELVVAGDDLMAPDFQKLVVAVAPGGR